MTEGRKTLTAVRNLILPGNPRYQPSQLQEAFGYDNLFREVAEVELAAFDTLVELGVISKEESDQLIPQIREQILAIPTTEVDRIERKITKHDVRAWIRIAQNLISGSAARWIHVSLTSYDPLDTARVLQFLKAYRMAIKPSIAEVVGSLRGLVLKFSNQIQIGRTHGQHALPITVGFWLATILSRVLYNWEQIDHFSEELVGKISGAVGAYNAQLALGFEMKARKKTGRTFEELVLAKVGLSPARISTQILPPEPLSYFLFSCVMLSAAFGQLGRDCRNLMRSEIGEVAEEFEAHQVGSSTMAHKRNPISFENLEGTFIKAKNEFGKVMDTLISEHQRDLVGSSVARDFPIILVDLQSQLNVLTRKNDDGVPFLKRLTVNRDACERNFLQSAGVILAEPLYIALQMAGYPGDAHELVNRRIVPRAQSSNQPIIKILLEVSQSEYDVAQAVDSMPKELLDLFWHPEKYTGDAERRAFFIVGQARGVLDQMGF